MNRDKKTNNRTGLHFKLLFLLFSAVLITTGTVSYQLAARELKVQLAQKCHALAATVAAVITENSDGYAAFLKDMDMESEYYRETKTLMMKLKEVNVKHVTYIYTMVQVDENTVMYVIGGEPPGSPVYTPPGFIDHGVTDAWRTAFKEQRAVSGKDFIDTPYGTRLSSYEPIFHKETGEFLGLVGADVTQSQYNSIMNIFIIQTVIGLMMGLFVFAVATWRLSGNVSFILNKGRYEAEFARRIVSTGRGYYQKMDEMYDKLHILRHDYKYHLNAARKMLGTGDAAGADQYLTVVEEKLSWYEPQSFCQNHVINALIADYAERCQKMDIQFDIRLNIPKTLGIPDYDLCIILGNLLENAVNACGKLAHTRVIQLETRSTRNQLLFMVKNNFNGEIHHHDGIPLSKKVNGGFGLRSVKEVIAGHNGDITFEWNEDSFTTFVAVRF
ncbi:GHKL domain-containing protein [Aminipila butyrica]|uniref:GHKL domain-containing protein n=1 Tax=Aminipila butyrica TaxID=433296 RepID=A0A858BTX1_9FIRM|nr:sensor histidine kinase [Aminipila butyrica]QIB68792.1 GHKL domain-containing protein [Aminipila butyrica]